MIKKLKENFLILLISNLVTVALVVIAPTILGVITNQSYIFRDEHLIFSLDHLQKCVADSFWRLMQYDSIAINVIVENKKGGINS